MAARKSTPEPEIPTPIQILPPSNGEFCPRPPSALALRAEALWRRAVEDHHHRAGMSRRDFASSACGTAAALWALNQAGCSSSDGSPAYAVDPEMMDDEARARTVLSGNDFIFDVQTHVVPPLNGFDQKSPPQGALDFVRQVFVQSDTSVVCVSGVPVVRSYGAEGVRANLALRALVERLGGPRLVLHANLEPQNGAAELDYMSEVAEAFPNVAAWKVYPLPGQALLDSEEIGQPFIERARALGITRVAAHRGISAGGGYASAGSPRDVVRAAQAAPDLQFLVYHSGWEQNEGEEAPFDAADPDPRGVNRLIKALLDTGLGPESNVYAELGTTWLNLMSAPQAAQHVIGKLLLYLGPERIVWGTDSVLNGNPQAQIEAFRVFQISEQLQEAYGYPALTSEIRAKIFGQNAARVYGVDAAATRYVIADDDVERSRLSYRDDPRSVPMPARREYEGPRTRREFFALRAREARERG